MTEQRAPYPLEVSAGGEAVTLRRLAPGDREAMLAFARSLPPHDLLFLRRDITDAAEIDAWIEAVETGTIETLIALVGGDVVGYCVVDRSPLAWMQHVAELRVMVGEAMRGKGLGLVLTTHAFRAASEMGVEKMVAQMTTDQRRAISVFQNLGFQNEALLRDQVKDRDGKTYDLLVLARPVSEFESSVILEELEGR
jgi:L-amino acid N-acyltransferase YncA